MNNNDIKELMTHMVNCNLKNFEYSNNGITLKIENYDIYENQFDNKLSKKIKVKEFDESLNDVNDNSNTTKETRNNFEAVKSPIVGVLYESPSPDKDAFVKLGDIVKKGDVVCIVEAMKVMNEITAEFDMKIIEKNAKNEDLLEYGQIIFTVERV
ncbi:acetyl-CoA carboxylase biotin carboxyl carrier protein [Helicovermis profundi]|uniref:Biotin carboxyl carrier protein of acetyl-CoA carboxylase n=1 Tax=Helicovermis profundi TaxID=3065157 RepID=A0AAU9E8U8_9FIRM|nr:acetyl-CoA carboxylase biotin carboxyl carrier protein [Clostridia bacterium S502]